MRGLMTYLPGSITGHNLYNYIRPSLPNTSIRLYTLLGMTIAGGLLTKRLYDYLYEFDEDNEQY
jgi:hypothetical protein